MPLDFRTVEEDEGFDWKRFLVRLSTGVGVFLVFLVIGHYGVAPLIFRTQSAPTAPAEQRALQTPPPKVEIYEKLPSDITAATGTIIGSREVAPFNYEEFDRKRKAQKQRPAEATPSDPEEPLVLVPEEEPEPSAPAPEEPATAPAEPELPVASPAEPEPPTTTPEPSPAAPPEERESKSEAPSRQARLYRVQVGVYESRENANQVLQTLIASGFEASIVPFQRDGRTLYRVQTLVTRDRARAEQAKQKLESEGFPATIIAVP